MVTATPHEDWEAFAASEQERDSDCRYCSGSGEREMSDTTSGPDCHTQLVSCPYCLGTGARMDCLPVPTDRHQGWPGVYAVLYTDDINDRQTCRDDLWIATGRAIRCVVEKAQTNAYAEGRDDEAKEHAWRPIKSAPVDENILIAATPDWVGEARLDLEYPAGVETLVWKWAGGDAIHPGLVPTRWMPLPKYPDAIPRASGCGILPDGGYECVCGQCAPAEQRS